MGLFNSVEDVVAYMESHTGVSISEPSDYNWFIKYLKQNPGTNDSPQRSLSADVDFDGSDMEWFKTNDPQIYNLNLDLYIKNANVTSNEFTYILNLFNAETNSIVFDNCNFESQNGLYIIRWNGTTTCNNYKVTNCNISATILSYLYLISISSSSRVHNNLSFNNEVNCGTYDLNIGYFRKLVCKDIIHFKPDRQAVFNGVREGSYAMIRPKIFLNENTNVLINLLPNLDRFACYVSPVFEEDITDWTNINPFSYSDTYIERQQNSLFNTDVMGDNGVGVWKHTDTYGLNSEGLRSKSTLANKGWVVQ